MSSWHSYSQIFNLGHKALENLFSNAVVIEEKIDGSQFSFGIHGGELRTRSKGREFHPEAVDKMFTAAVEKVKAVQHLLTEGYTYRGEYLSKPRHNALAYDRIPTNHIMIFDVETSDSDFLLPEARAAEAARLGFECIPVFHSGPYSGSMTELLKLLERVSVLGGQKIEGVVVKNYDQFGSDKKVLMGKYVSEAFKEVHGANWKSMHPGKKDIMCILQDTYRTPARWNKAIQHIREAGLLTETPKDIGLLMKEVNQDILKECKDEIKEILFKWAWKDLSRMLTAGLPEFYKQKLAENQSME